jgi:hypothetical protein
MPGKQQVHCHLCPGHSVSMTHCSYCTEHATSSQLSGSLGAVCLHKSLAAQSAARAAVAESHELHGLIP